MANGRLWLREKNSKARVLLAKHMGGIWYGPATLNSDRMDEFLTAAGHPFWSEADFELEVED